MLKACSVFIVLVAVAVLVLPDPKQTLGEPVFRGIFKAVSLVHPETHETGNPKSSQPCFLLILTGTSREYRTLDHLFRMFSSLNAGQDVGEPPEIFDVATKNMESFPLVVPPRKDVKRTFVSIPNNEVCPNKTVLVVLCLLG